MNSQQVPPILNSVKHLIEPTRTSFISVTTWPVDYTLPEESKFGGMPYWPENLPYPKINNKPAKLMAQINFEDLARQNLSLPDFPTTGVLQFFFAHGDDMWGINFDDFSKPNIKAVYHKNTSMPISEDNTILKTAVDNNEMPFESPLAIKFEMRQEYAGFSDAVATHKFYSSIDGELSDEQEEAFYDVIENSGSKLGGYAYFTQCDPRTVDEDWVLLLQIDSDDHLMFGDSGVANWFILREDLKNLNFDNVRFNWDCC